MHDRYVNYHGLNNLIWVWNSVSPDWYPGDDVVDILTYDSYPATTGDHGAVSATYQSLVTLGSDKKLVGLAEVGEIPDPALLQAYHADWFYFVVWYALHLLEFLRHLTFGQERRLHLRRAT